MKLYSAIGIVLLFGVTGLLACSKEENSDPHDDHDHAPGETHSDDDGHGHEDEHDHGHDDEHDGGKHSLGSVTIGGTTLEVTVGGDPHPNETLHVDLLHSSGTVPDSIRVWFGEQSGIGSLKGKGEGSDGRYHADAEVPGKVTAAMRLWIEVEAGGKRASGSLAMD